MRKGEPEKLVEGDIYQGEVGGQNAIGTFFSPAQVLIQGAQPVSGGDVVVRWDGILSAKPNFYLQAYFDRTNCKSLQFDETRDTFHLDFVDHIGYLPRQGIIFLGLRESPSNLIQTHATVNFTPNRLTDYIYIYGGFLQDRVEMLPNRGQRLRRRWRGSNVLFCARFLAVCAQTLDWRRREGFGTQDVQREVAGETAVV